MQNAEDYIPSDSSIQSKSLFVGFFSNLSKISCMIFTIVPSLIAWYLSKDFKIMLLVLVPCILIALTITVRKNISSNENLLKSTQADLNKSCKEIKTLKENISNKNTEIEGIKSELANIKLNLNDTITNRDTILEGFNNYKQQAILYSSAYNSVKYGMTVLANMQNDENIKQTIANLIKNTEEDLLERNEDIERGI